MAEEKRVVVFMDERRVNVPRHVHSWASLRQVLGVAEGFTVAVEAELEEGLCWIVLGTSESDGPGQVVRNWQFSSDERYKSIALSDIESEDDERQPWSTDPDAWKS